ncbi:hypothetical protein [Sphingomonas sp. 10B4]|uniref:hypothetical protein n=1 Tax=Sphingomonas sp. 10B4 TaxID=3048575 RepID=UPI002AB4E13D|nr:hypothetical protein [Sphingomonas sp. 10B4]MDY7525510.1 hypothetical protein [Sphingomonas sp. 10B4]MEB0281456.1 hypothetical protein [Sphingomonas sp. 10B4]
MNLDLAPTTITAIEGFLAKRDIADVPGLMRKHHQIIVTRADVVEIYNRIAVSKLGRTAVRNATQVALSVPADFAEHAPTSCNPDLAQRYGVSINIISRWRNETGCRAPKPVPPTVANAAPIPDGFALVAPTMTMKQLRLRFGRSSHVVHRWLTLTNTKPKKLQSGYRNGPTNAVLRDMTAVGQVADYLRRWGPVFRCNKVGQADPRGTHWRRGLAILTDVELTDRAVAKGYDAGAWERIAA